MTHSESMAAIGAALAKAQGVMGGAAKESRNDHFGSRYADLASVVDACRVALASNGIAYLQTGSTFEGNLVRMTTMLIHSSGEWILSDELQVQARDAGPQAIGSCLTYLRRFQLASMVGVAPEDDDAEAAEARPHPKPNTPPSRPQPIPPGKPSPPQKSVPPPAARPEPPPLTDRDIPF